MLLREKIIVILAALVCSALLVDLYTPFGNFLLEKYTNSSERFLINQHSKIGYINRRGRLAIKPQFDDGLAYFNNDLTPMAINGKWGFTDKYGRWVIKPTFYSAGEFYDDLASASNRKGITLRYGYINRLGQFAIEPKFDIAKEFSNNLACVKTEDKWGYINKTGEYVIQSQFEQAQSFVQGLAGVQLDGKWGFINTQGQFIVEPKFTAAKKFSEGLAPVNQDNLWGYVDLSGQTVIDFQFESAQNFKDGLAAIKLKNTVGFIDTKGNITIQKDYFTNVKDFSEGLAAVQVSDGYSRKLKNKWGYIDSTGTFTIEPKFDWAWSFDGGLARVGLSQNDLRRGYVNPAGRLIWDPANWERGYYSKRLMIRLGIIIIFWYFLIVILSYRRHIAKVKIKINKFLDEQAVSRNGTVVQGGMSSSPQLRFNHDGVNFTLAFSRFMTDNQQPEIYVFSDTLLHEEHVISWTMKPNLSKLEAMNSRQMSALLLENPEFNQSVRILSVDNESYALAFLTSEIQQKILQLKSFEYSIWVGIEQQRFYIRFVGMLDNKEKYDWFLDLATICNKRMETLSKDKTKSSKLV